MKEIISNLVKWSNGEKAPPHKVLIYPTNKCNLKCKMCEHTHWKEPNVHLPYEKFLYVLNCICR